MKKNFKKNILFFLGIWFFTMILSNVFLKMHYSSDTYVLIDLGYMEYPKKWFLLDGRIISSIFCYIAGFFKIPYDVYIIGMDFFAILFLSFSIFVIFFTYIFFCNSIICI